MSGAESRIVRYLCEERSQASAAAAALLARRLREDLATGSRAGLVVSGGSTPADCLNRLAKETLSWDRVDVCLTDERCVPVDSDLSNARMVRAQLLEAGAREATLHSLTETGIAALPLPFSAVLVGMGTDGHFASIFPDMPDLGAALDVVGAQSLMTVRTAASPVTRVTMTLALLLNAQQIVLLAFGEEKRRILAQPGALPVATLLAQTITPITVVWAP
ncbi:MAG: 6-phosphogluconolactonase [Pseudomonadota bacterium]